MRISDWRSDVCSSDLLGGTDDVKTDETLTVDGNLVTGGSLNVTGGAGDDAIRGGAKADVLNGGAGDDILLCGAGDDTINGGDGDEVISGGDVEDSMDGGAGDDIVAVTVTHYNSERAEVFGDADENTPAIDGAGSATVNIHDLVLHRQTP